MKKNNEIDFNDLEKYNISSLIEYEGSTQNSRIQFELGARYYLGKKVKQDYKKAVKWFELSAEQGDDDGQFGLGLCYLNGNGVEQDDSEAVKWFKLSANEGNESGQFSLGKCFYHGIGIKQDYKKAVKWFELSAEQGDDDAQYYLGLCYLNGNGVKQDNSEAIKLFKLSSDQGNDDAQKELKKIQKKASGIDCYDAVVEISEGASTKVLSNSLENGNDPDVIYSVNDSDGEYDFSITALALAVKMLDTETFSKVLKIFLKYNANINKADNEGDTALHVACKLLDREKANILIHYGADVDIENEKGLTPKDYFTNAMEKKNNKKKVGGTIGAFIGGALGGYLGLDDDAIKDLGETFGEFGSWLGGKS